MMGGGPQHNAIVLSPLHPADNPRGHNLGRFAHQGLGRKTLGGRSARGNGNVLPMKGWRCGSGPRVRTLSGLDPPVRTLSGLEVGAGDAKVQQLDLTLRGELNVGELDVAMDQPQGIAVGATSPPVAM